MDTKITVMDRLRKEVIPGINLFELCLFIFATVVGVTLFILSITIWSESTDNKDYFGYAIAIIDIPLGVLAATFLSKRHKLAPALLAIDAIFYGTSNFLAGNFALFFVNAVLTPVIYLVAFFVIWPKMDAINKDTNEIETRKLNVNSGLIIAGSAILVAVLFGVSITLIKDTSTIVDNKTFEYVSIWFDSFAASLMLMAVIAATLRFREVWYLYFTSNIIKLVLFSWSLALGNMDDLLVLVLAVTYLMNTIFGMLIWKDSENVSKQKGSIE